MMKKRMEGMLQQLACPTHLVRDCLWIEQIFLEVASTAPAPQRVQAQEPQAATMCFIAMTKIGQEVRTTTMAMWNHAALTQKEKTMRMVKQKPRPSRASLLR